MPRPAHGSGSWRFGLWGAILLVAAEYALFSFAFDSAVLRQRADGWSSAGYLGSLGMYMAVTALGAVVVVTGQAAPRFAGFATGRQIDRTAVTLLGLHLSVLTGLWWVTTRLFAPSGPPSGSPLAWVSLWAAAMLAAPLLAFAAASPSGFWRQVLPDLRSMLFGGALVGAGAWLAGLGSASLWWPLGPWTLDASAVLLRLLVAAPYYDPEHAVLGTHTFRVLLSPACSGLEGIGLTVVFVTSYLVLSRDRLRFPQALLLLPLGLVASLVANLLRIVLLVLVGSFISVSVAGAGFHARAGWLFFCTLALGLVALSQRTAFFARTPERVSLATPTAAYLLPFLSLVAVAMVAGLSVVAFDYWYGLRIAGAAIALVAYRRSYGGLRQGWGVPAAVGGAIAAIGFIALSPAPPGEMLTAWRAEWDALPPLARAIWLTVRVLGSVIVIPLAEELAFRGYVLRRVIAADFDTVPAGQVTWLALAVSSAAFATVHNGWWAGLFAGCVFGLVQRRGGSVGHAVAAHAVSNGLVAAYVIAGQQWWLWI